MIDASKYLHKWWLKTRKQSHAGRSLSPRTEHYYFLDIRSKQSTEYNSELKEKVPVTLYGFLAMKIVWDGSRVRVSFTNPGEQYIKYYESFFDGLEKENKRKDLRYVVKDLFTKDFDKWTKQYSGWKNLL